MHKMGDKSIDGVKDFRKHIWELTRMKNLHLNLAAKLQEEIDEWTKYMIKIEDEGIG